MTQGIRVLSGLALIAVLAADWGCSRAPEGLPLGAAQSAETAVAAPRVPSGSTSLGADDTNNLGSFPAFMPPVAVGTETQECRLGTDPYSTCI